MNSIEPPPLIPNPASAGAPLPHMSLPARLLNIFAIPGEVFRDVKAAPRSLANWLVPVVLATLVGAAGVISIAQPALIKDLQESRTKAFAEQVAAGKISQSDADRVLATLDWITQPAVLKAGGTLVSFGISVVRVFGWALALWVFGAVFLKTRFSFLKALEIAGLATMICVLESVVALVLTSGFGGAAPVESLAQLAAANQTPLRLIVGNLFSIWFVGLMAIGLARLAETQFSRTFMLVLGAWVASQLLLALVGAVLLALAG